MANKFKKDTFKEYVTILFGLALYALGWTGFLLPHQITACGRHLPVHQRRFIDHIHTDVRLEVQFSDYRRRHHTYHFLVCRTKVHT